MPQHEKDIQQRFNGLAKNGKGTTGWCYHRKHQRIVEEQD